MSERKLSEAQKRLLKRAPGDWERWPLRGFRRNKYLVSGRTTMVLIEKGLIEAATIPPRWRIAAAGRTALSIKETE